MDASPSFICVLLGCHQMLSDRMFPRRAGPSLWAAEGGPGPRATGGGGGPVVRAGGQAGEDSLLSLPSRRPPTPRRCPARGASKLCAWRPLVPRSGHCAGARAPSPPRPREDDCEDPWHRRAPPPPFPGVLSSPWTTGRRPRGAPCLLFL